MLEKFGDNRSLVANLCPSFYTSSKTSIGFYARKCISGGVEWGGGGGGGGEGGPTFQVGGRDCPITSSIFSRRGRWSGPPAHPHLYPSGPVIRFVRFDSLRPINNLSVI